MTDWSRLRKYFAPDATYRATGAGPFSIDASGRDAVLDGLRQAVEQLDRRFDTREVALTSELAVNEGIVSFDWRGDYSVAGAPTLTIGGHETVEYDNDLILHLHDAFTAETLAAIEDWIAEHGDKRRS